MQNGTQRSNWKIVGWLSFAVFILAVAFSFNAWFLVPVDPIAPSRKEIESKAMLAIAGLLVAAGTFWLWHYCRKRAT